MEAHDRYDSLIVWYFYESSRKYGPDPAADWRLVKAQIRAESDFNPLAISKAGAMGLMQLMVRTALELDVTDPTNPEESIRGGTEYLWRQWSTFKREKGLERWRFALGAYNAGAGNIIEAQGVAQDRGGDSKSWADVSVALSAVTGAENASETIHYVNKIVAEFTALRSEGRGE